MHTESAIIPDCSTTIAVSPIGDLSVTSKDLTFADIGVDADLVAILQRQKITIPTAIQERAIPVAQSGKDVIGIAQTGTGKTLAFVLPIIRKLLVSNGKALIVVPTRELAQQVEDSIRLITSHLNTKLLSVVLIGGASMGLQRERLSRNPRIIVATPGRLQDHLQQRTLTLSKVEIAVLDEADRMFDMGFAPQIRKFLELIPATRQTMLFSATMPPEIASLASRHLKDPVRIDITPPGTSVEKISQEICFVDRDKKRVVLEKLLKESDGLTIVFSRTKHGAKDLTMRIKSMGFSVTEIHSNRSLGQRKQALAGFKTGRYDVLVATDIASRGIDVNDVKLVVNYDLPDAKEDYVHRIGRTGRAGREGKAISLASYDQLRDVRDIERLTGVNFILSIHSMPRPQEKAGRSSSSNRRSFAPRRGRTRSDYNGRFQGRSSARY